MADKRISEFPQLAAGALDGAARLLVSQAGDTKTTSAAEVAALAGGALQTSLNAKAPLASPAFTGTPTAPTPSGATNSAQLATTAFVQGLVAALSDDDDAIAALTSAVNARLSQSAADALYVPLDDARLTDARPPSGGAGGALSGNYPNPGFAVDMATQAELDAAALALQTQLDAERAARQDVAQAILTEVYNEMVRAQTAEGTNTAAAAANASAINALKIYDVPIGIAGKPGAAQSSLQFTIVRAFTLPASLTNSRASAGTASSATVVFSLRKNNVEFGTVTFASSAVGTFAAASATAFAAGDLLTLVSPATAPATIANVSVTLAGVLS